MSTTQEESPLKLERQLCHRVYLASNLLTRLYRPMLTPLDLTYPQYIIMMALWEKDKVSILDIIERTQIDGGSLSLMLKKLEGKKFLEVEGCSQDKRRKIVALTRKGKSLYKKALTIPEQLRCQFGDLYNEDEYGELLALLDRLNVAITEAGVD